VSTPKSPARLADVFYGQNGPRGSSSNNKHAGGMMAVTPLKMGVVDAWIDLELSTDPFIDIRCTSLSILLK
jgi:hypothetical protein